MRAVVGVVMAGFDHFRQALDVGGELNDLPANTCVAVGDLVRWAWTGMRPSGKLFGTSRSGSQFQHSL